MACKMIITLDGPAGSGKSTIAQKLAERLNMMYLDTGAMYRAITLAALDNSWPVDNPAKLAEHAGSCRIDFDRENNRNVVKLNGLDVTERIRSQEVTDNAHYIAGNPAIRQLLVAWQQEIGHTAGSLVTEGRDQGTVVFPNADYKFYIDATPECRAKRRWLQMNDSSISYEQILASQLQRDRRDAERDVGAMKMAEDAMIVDTTEMTLDEVVDKLLKIIEKTPGPLS